MSDEMSSIPIAGLPEVFRSAAHFGGGFTIVAPDGTRSFRSQSDLLDEAEIKAAGLLDEGIEPGDKVALFARTSHAFILGCLSVWRAGAIVVPLAFPHRFAPKKVWMQRAAERAEATGARALLVGADDEREGLDLRSIELAGLTSSSRLDFAGPGPQDTAFIQFTSGSTARPRGVVLSHGTLATQFELFRQGLGGRRGHAHIVSWLPLFHDMGMVANVMTTLAFGIKATLMPTEMFILDPGSWILEISRSRATASSAPAFAYALAARAIERGLPEQVDLSCWDRAVSGSEAVNTKPVERFFKAAAPLGFDPGNFSSGYGLAEATCMVTIVKPGEGLTVDRVSRRAVAEGRAEPTTADSEAASKFVSCGRPIPGLQLEVVGVDGAPLEERAIGEVRIAGPTLMDGYYEEPEATAAMLRDGWLYTGDLGYIADGQLYITGRAKDVVILRGQNFSSEDLERVTEEVPGTKWGCTVAVGIRQDDSESLVVAAETPLKEEADLEQLSDAIRRHLFSQAGVSVGRVVLLPPRTLPRTTSGKLQRHRFRDLYESGGIDLSGPVAQLKDDS